MNRYKWGMPTSCEDIIHLALCGCSLPPYLFVYILFIFLPPHLISRYLKQRSNSVLNINYCLKTIVIICQINLERNKWLTFISQFIASYREAFMSVWKGFPKRKKVLIVHDVIGLCFTYYDSQSVLVMILILVSFFC